MPCFYKHRRAIICIKEGLYMSNKQKFNVEGIEVVKIDELNLMGMKPNLLFVRYLMASYLYYERDEVTPWTDHQYDVACKILYDKWEEVTHKHKVFVDHDSLKAGTGFDIRVFPTIVKVSAYQWRDGLLPKQPRVLGASEEEVCKGIKKFKRNPVAIEQINNNLYIGTPS